MQTILTVDDSASLRKLISVTLLDAGYEVLEAEDGEQGLEVLQTAKPDLILSDVNMPNMDGIEFAGLARAIPDFKFTPIVMLSTECGEDMMERGRLAGATGWLVKPFNADKLLLTIKKALG